MVVLLSNNTERPDAQACFALHAGSIRIVRRWQPADRDILYSVTGRTEAGCVTTDSVRVMLADDAMMELPNAFTPGMSPNRLFSIIHRGSVTLKSFRISNRWGSVVFATSGINQGWDGRYQGEPQPIGIYVYMLEGTTSKGNIIRRSGIVTLLR